MLRASMLGEVLGNYRVTAVLDSGGMGSVYRAEHTHLGRPAAIKLLHPELTTNAEIVKRFFNEAKAATAIRHPGIVEVFDFGYTTDGRAYFVMELLDGQSLKKRRKDAGGRLSEADAARIARDIATVLKAAHAKGIVHRDLKPDNVFLVPDDDGGDRIKVLDFGVAKLADVFTAETRHTQTGALMGTPVYMAPEQARSAAAIDHRADLYSLGCMLYELVAGVPPFDAEGAGEIIALQMFAPPQPLRERLQSVSPELEAIVAKLLEKEPHDRYQNAAEVVAALNGVMAQLATRPSAERLDANIKSPRFTYTPGSQQLTVPSRAKTGTLEDDRPTELTPPKKSSMPIIAAAVTVLLAGGAAIFALTRGGDEAPAATPDAAVVVEPAPTPVPAKKPDPKPALTQEPVQDIRVVEDAKPTGTTAKTVKAKTPPKKSEPEGVPVTRPEGVEPLKPPPDEEVRTPITKRPLEGTIE